MKGFEQYDLQWWLDNGLSFHPEAPKPAPHRARDIRGYITRMSVPLIAMSALGTSGAMAATSDADFMVNRQLVIAAQTPCVIFDARSGPVPLSGGIDDFEANAVALLAEIRTGALSNVSAETLALAAAAAGRHVDADQSGRPAWVDKVAGEVAQLTD